ncbi:MAG: hypothetical protein ACNA8W_03140, partial [Bradymonadaceae bacterium]
MARTKIYKGSKSAACAVLAMGIFCTSSALGQSTPAELGAGQSPYILFVFDTSASMEWTDAGDETYPIMDRDVAASGSSDFQGNRHLEEWQPFERLYLPGSKINGVAVDTMNFPDARRIDTVGPCYVWHPMDQGQLGAPVGNADCEEYNRPGHCTTGNDCKGVSYRVAMRNRRDDHMKENSEMRLSNTNKPRHVTVKEILTGDMYWTGEAGETTGPGCWFVPRMRGSLLNEQVCATAPKQFDSYVDYDDPRPHIQEVWNRQDNNGLMDTMASTAIFSVAMFDGYRYDGTRAGGWQYPITDIMGGESPYKDALGTTEDNNLDCGWEKPGTTPTNPACYDMGVYRVIGPNNFDLGLDFRRAASEYSQRTIIDAGFLSLNAGSSGNNPLKLDGDRKDGFPRRFDREVDEYIMGKQPISMSTPFGGVFHDLHQFFMSGQHSGSKAGPLRDPHNEDPYKMCRPRHVVLFTDGYPEPELPDGAGGGIGSEMFDGNWGFDQPLYKYKQTETAIERMLTAMKERFIDGEVDRSLLPRVHVVGINVDADAAKQDQVIHKMARMAEQGETCAQFYLPPHLIPTGVPLGPGSHATLTVGTCDPVNDFCLLEQNRPNHNNDVYPGYFYEYEEGVTFLCEHPALVFNRNGKDVMRDAFQRVFNEILNASGVATRTRPSMTSYLDDNEKQGQYRLFSGLRMGGVSVFWQGLIQRQTLACHMEDGDPGNEADVLSIQSDSLHIHEQINALRYPIGEALPLPPDAEYRAQDRRRVFTSVVANKEPGASASVQTTAHTSAAQQFFFNRYNMVTKSAVDEFGESDEGGALGTRIPVRDDDLKGVYTGDLGWDPAVYHEYFRLFEEDADDNDDMFTELVDEMRGRVSGKHDRV